LPSMAAAISIFPVAQSPLIQSLVEGRVAVASFEGARTTSDASDLFLKTDYLKNASGGGARQQEGYGGRELGGRPLVLPRVFKCGPAGGLRRPRVGRAAFSASAG